MVQLVLEIGEKKNWRYESTMSITIRNDNPSKNFDAGKQQIV